MSNGKIFAFMSATAVCEYGDGCDDYGERHGWIDPAWSRSELFESRNDVTPLIAVWEDDPALKDDVYDVIADGEFFEDNGDGTFYLQDENMVDGWSYTYAVHFVRKFCGPNGWTEQAWHPVTDGGITVRELVKKGG